jgi:hypothetical protein
MNAASHRAQKRVSVIPNWLDALLFLMRTSTPWKSQVANLIPGHIWFYKKKKKTKQPIQTWISSTAAQPGGHWWVPLGLHVHSRGGGHGHMDDKSCLKSPTPYFRPTVAVPWPTPRGGTPGRVLQRHARVKLQRGMLRPARRHPIHHLVLRRLVLMRDADGGCGNRATTTRDALAQHARLYSQGGGPRSPDPSRRRLGQREAVV